MSQNALEQCEGLQVAGFISKLYQMLENDHFHKIVNWNSSGSEFAIKDSVKFQSVVLPNYFRHNKINSFVRQLNMYGFHKSRKEHSKSTFSHPLFLKARKDLLPSIKRKVKAHQQESSGLSATPNDGLKNIFKENPIEQNTQAIKQQAAVTNMNIPHFNESCNYGMNSFRIGNGHDSRNFRLDINLSLNKVSQTELSEILQKRADDQASIEDEIEDKEAQMEQLEGVSSVLRFQNPTEFLDQIDHE